MPRTNIAVRPPILLSTKSWVSSRGYPSPPPTLRPRRHKLLLELEDPLLDLQPLLLGEKLVEVPLLQDLQPFGYTHLRHGNHPPVAGPRGATNTAGAACVDTPNTSNYNPL